MLAYQLGQEEGRGGSHDEGDHHQRQRMGECGAVTPFTIRKGREELGNAFAEVDGKAKDRTQLNHDRVHLPVAAREVESEDLFGDAQMRGGAYGEKFREALDNAEEQGKKVVVHRINL